MRYDFYNARLTRAISYFWSNMKILFESNELKMWNVKSIPAVQTQLAFFTESQSKKCDVQDDFITKGENK